MPTQGPCTLCCPKFDNMGRNWETWEQLGRTHEELGITGANIRLDQPQSTLLQANKGLNDAGWANMVLNWDYTAHYHPLILEIKVAGKKN